MILKGLGREDLGLFLEGDRVEVHAEEGITGVMVIGEGNPVGLTNQIENEDGDPWGYQIVIECPSIINERNLKLFFFAIEHEFIHVGIFLLEGTSASRAFDKTWYGNDLALLYLYRKSDCGQGYDRGD